MSTNYYIVQTDALRAYEQYQTKMVEKNLDTILYDNFLTIQKYHIGKGWGDSFRFQGWMDGSSLTQEDVVYGEYLCTTHMSIPMIPLEGVTSVEGWKSVLLGLSEDFCVVDEFNTEIDVHELVDSWENPSREGFKTYDMEDTKYGFCDPATEASFSFRKFF